MLVIHRITAHRAPFQTNLGSRRMVHPMLDSIHRGLGGGYSIYIITQNHRKEIPMFGFSAWKRSSDIRRLNKDAPIIIEYARQTTRPDRIREIARVTAQHLDRAHKIFEPTSIGLKRAIYEYQRLHNEARRQHDNVSLSAFTLVLIYIRAENMGKDCRPALDTIDAFLGEWEHTNKDEEPLTRP